VHSLSEEQKDWIFLNQEDILGLSKNFV
jgi:hypothetical protein